MAYFTENREQPLKPGEVRISVGRMETGFEIPECHLLVIAEGDIFTSKELKKRKKLPVLLKNRDGTEDSIRK